VNFISLLFLTPNDRNPRTAMTQPEAQMEELLIGQLTHHESQWTFRPDIKTEAALWANLREKLD
ncbi:hypothetical protein HMPREF9440_01220, partial [Sutterella parvirubra YIT 11816]